MYEKGQELGRKKEGEAVAGVWVRGARQERRLGLETRHEFFPFKNT